MALHRRRRQVYLQLGLRSSPPAAPRNYFAGEGHRSGPRSSAGQVPWPRRSTSRCSARHKATRTAVLFGAATCSSSMTFSPLFLGHRLDRWDSPPPSSCAAGGWQTTRASEQAPFTQATEHWLSLVALLPRSTIGLGLKSTSSARRYTRPPGRPSRIRRAGRRGSCLLVER